MSKNKRTLTIYHQIINAKYVFCYGEKAYTKYIKKEFKADENIKQSGVSTLWAKEDGEVVSVIGLKEHKDIVAFKALFVHELSHSITQLFREFGFNCDELRSYLMQYLYQETIIFIDNIAREKQKVSQNEVTPIPATQENFKKLMNKTIDYHKKCIKENGRMEIF